MPTRIFMMYCHCCKVTILANSRRCHGGSGSERAFHEHEPVAQVGWPFAVRSDFAEAKALVEGDKKAVDQYRAKYQSLVTEKAEAEQDGDHQRVEEIEDEMAQNADAITAGARQGDKRERARASSPTGVTRAIKQIERWDKPLAEHLKASIKHGNEVVYRPGMPIAWDVRSIVNA